MFKMSESDIKIEHQWQKIKRKSMDINKECLWVAQLISRIQSHSSELCLYIESVCKTNHDIDMKYFNLSETEITLHKYLELLVSITCNTEIIMMNEIKKWEACIDDYIPVRDRSADSVDISNLVKEMQSLKCMDQVGVCNEYVSDTQNATNEQYAVNWDSSVNELPEKCQNYDDEERNNEDKCTCHTDEVISMKTRVGNELKVKQLQVSPNMKFKGCIETVFSTTELYTYLLSNDTFMETMESLDKELAQHYKNFKAEDRAEEEKLSVMVKKAKLMNQTNSSYALLISESNRTFHRVEVKDWRIYEKDKNVVVFFLDSGNVMDVSVDQLYPMPCSFANFPALATRCQLTGVTSVHMQEVVNLILSWGRCNDIVVLYVDDVESDSISVSIYDMFHRVCLNKLVQNLVNNLKKQEISYFNNWDPMRYDYESASNNYAVNIDDPATAMNLYVNRDLDRCCPLYRDTGKCFKGMYCRKEHINLDLDGYTTEKQEVFKSAFKNMTEINVGDETQVVITTTIDMTRFYCILDNFVSSDSETLESLICEMNTNQSIARMKRLLIPPAIGQIVIAQSDLDKYWYRARVVNCIPDDEMCTVFFVDYGRTEDKALDKLRNIEPKLLHLPFQALHCELYGVIDSGKMKSCNQSLTRMFKGRHKIKIVSIISSELTSLLVRLYDGQGQDVANVLLEKEFVVKNEHILADSESAIFPV